MEENKTNALYCSHCGALIGEDEDYEEVDGEIVCMDCVNNYTCTCDECNELIFTSESYGDEYTTLCSSCYNTRFTRCSCCDALIRINSAEQLDGYD